MTTITKIHIEDKDKFYKEMYKELYIKNMSYGEKLKYRIKHKKDEN